MECGQPEFIFSVNHYIYCIVNGLITIPGFFYQNYALIQLAIYVILSLKKMVLITILITFQKKYELNLQQLDQIEQKITNLNTNKNQ